MDLLSAFDLCKCVINIINNESANLNLIEPFPLNIYRVIIFQAYADALEVVPYTLAENAGLNPITTVTDLRNRHANGDSGSGINVRRGGISSMEQENVVQPLLVSISAIELATETVRSIMKIDDIVNTRGQ